MDARPAAPATIRARRSSGRGAVAWLVIAALLLHGAAARAVLVQPPGSDICYTAGKVGGPAPGAVAHEHCALCAFSDAATAGHAPRIDAAANGHAHRYRGAGIAARRLDAPSQRAPPA